MNKKIIIVAIFFAIVVVLAYRFGSVMCEAQRSPVTIIKNDHIYFDNSDEHVALIGCTPRMPSFCLEPDDTKAILNRLANLRIVDYIDEDDLRDSFFKTLIVCKERKIDCLVIAYLPIYFIEAKSILKTHFTVACRAYLKAIAPQIIAIIGDQAKKAGYLGKIILSLPSDQLLDHIPASDISFEERTCYLIKQFPRLHGLEHVVDITIINNKSEKNDEENKEIINLFRYEYLYEARLQFIATTFGKRRFHSYFAC